jgi:hypothetical protein
MENNSWLAEGREAVSGKCGDITKVYGLVKQRRVICLQ